MIRDLDLSKEKAEVLGSRLKQWNLVKKGVRVTSARHRHEELSSFYKMDGQLCYCDNAHALMTEMCGTSSYRPQDWRLFIDSGKNTLKAVLLHNGNQFLSVPVAHAYGMNESYETMKILLSAVNYGIYQWSICADLKVIALVLGLQTGHTKNMCFLCLWDSRADEKHYLQNVWPPRPSNTTGKFNCVHEQLVDPQKILLPPLHLKLGLVKTFIKAMNPANTGFQYLIRKFKNVVSEAKLRAGILNGLEIRSLIDDNEFLKVLTLKEKSAWLAFVDVARNFLGMHRAENYKDIVHRMLLSYCALQVRMSLKIHFFTRTWTFFHQTWEISLMNMERGFTRKLRKWNLATEAVSAAT